MTIKFWGPETSTGGEPGGEVVAATVSTALTIAGGSISTPLDGTHKVVRLSEAVPTWTAQLPVGADGSTAVYWSSLDVLPPVSGGPFTMAIPAEWLCLGPIDAISLGVGAMPISVTLRSWGASGIAYTAAQAALP